jgi:DNA replication protein DnaC
MLNHPTLDRLHEMGLFGMAKAFADLGSSDSADGLTHGEWLALLLDREWTYRYDRKLASRLRYARLRHQATVEDVDYRAARGLDRALFQKLIIGDWIDAHDNLVITGPTDLGSYCPSGDLLIIPSLFAADLEMAGAVRGVHRRPAGRDRAEGRCCG